MTQPVWSTGTNLGSYNTGQQVSIRLIARAFPPAASISYEVSAGSLPPGLTLSSSGVISGVPTSTSNLNSTFIITATDNLGEYSTKTFSISIVYTPIQPVWNTPAGTLGTYPAGIPVINVLSATPVTPATSLTYSLLSGSLPSGLVLSSTGVITGTPTLVSTDITYTFTVRATDNLTNIRDRTFSLTISGAAIPSFDTPDGSLMSIQDSNWIEYPITYTNPDSQNPVVVELKEGILPPGLEINSAGVIRGYAEPPTASVTLPNIITSATGTTDGTNLITCLSTAGFEVGRPVIFGGTAIGNIELGVTYYIKSIENSTTFTISATQNGPTFLLNTDVGFMTVLLPAVSVGQPTIRTYTFGLRLVSPLGSDTATYSITVINQNTPVSQGGPGYTPNTRKPTIYNTRPATYNITSSDLYYGYYILPPVSPSTPAFIGTIKSGDYFAFKIIGHDFDGNALRYSFSGLPLGLTGNTTTGWITGTPTLVTAGLSGYNFSVAVYKQNNPTIMTDYFNFSLNISNEIEGIIVWDTPSSLGTIFNGTISTLSVSATSDVALSYRVTSGALPPNLTLLSNGQITGLVADQPTDVLLEKGTQTDFTFTIQAYSELYPIIQSEQTFTLTVLQEYSQPTDVLYIKAAPSIEDRQLIASLLNNEALIPTASLYRPEDVYFGKATSVIYEHAFGIYASNIDQYIAAVTRNHYWRNITLGQLKTAVAKNSAGEVVYEVVYSEVIDNLINPQGVSVSEEIYWPRLIDLGLGPWYTSVTNVFTSYVDIDSQLFYTSLTPGYARTLYPNSLYNMRQRVSQQLGQEFDSRLLPLWMTSQQPDGSTLGYTQAWVICYTKPGLADGIKANIEANWGHTLNEINFRIDRFSVDKSATYNYDNNFVPPAWTGLPSATPVPDPLDSKDFYVLFPRQTILPDETQY